MSSGARVVIAGASFPDCSAAIDLLRESIDADVADATRLSTAEIVELLPAADALMTDYFPVNAAAIDQLKRCQIICRLGVGVDKIDVAAATRAQIPVTYVPDYCRGELADHALALLLAVARRIVHYDRAVRSGTWDYNVPGVFSSRRTHTGPRWFRRDREAARRARASAWHARRSVRPVRLRRRR